MQTASKYEGPPPEFLDSEVEVKYRLCDLMLLVYQVSATIGLAAREYQAYDNMPQILITSTVIWILIEIPTWLLGVNILNLIGIEKTWHRTVGLFLIQLPLIMAWVSILE